MSEPTGQILPGSKFGNVLTQFAKLSDMIVEIGTWHGEGSTRCIANGLVRPEQRFITIDCDPKIVSEAKARYNDSRITFLEGAIVNEFRSDLVVILDKIPERIDLLLIDGGEYEGRQEWLLLNGRCRWIAIDDTRETKNRVNRQDMIDAGWKVLFDEQDDRNGWALFERS